jgi:hypothetical protein
MLAATHAIAGAALLKISPNPFSGYLLALLSHPILDFIPHWDMKTRHVIRPKKFIIFYSMVDASIGFFLGFLLFSNSIPPMQLALAMFLAQLPDWLEAPYSVLDFKFPPFSWIKSFQHRVHNKLAFPNGLLTQFILIFLLLLLSID